MKKRLIATLADIGQVGSGLEPDVAHHRRTTREVPRPALRQV